MMNWMSKMRKIPTRMIPNFSRTLPGHDKALRLMQGFFRANGGCGYVKKPDFLLMTGPNGEVFDPKGSFPVKKTLKVKVYMGDGWHMDFSKTHFDAFSPPDFYTRVGITGVKADTVKQTTVRLRVAISQGVQGMRLL
ncbi:phosphoinositide phospholipase C 2-like [Miscanthus floridulus]|uniref:phosphoinositide phospholipase C 2-like n=1 Tax=Miscanthus floridulus TaxID=154761 RepID=UPI0034594683